mmetsp:Transcript_17228/g.26925  ORF Transcript_17228/g.26925 Transcript_17228/m.26925 type:complete len:209 (-) Transcript_17228:90-716(-)
MEQRQDWKSLLLDDSLALRIISFTSVRLYSLSRASCDPNFVLFAEDNWSLLSFLLSSPSSILFSLNLVLSNPFLNPFFSPALPGLLGEVEGKGVEGKGEEEEEVFVHDDALSSSPSSSSSSSSDVVINLSSPVRSLNQPKHYSQQLEEIEEPETPRNVYFAIPSSANRYLVRVEEPERGHGGMEVGEDGEIRDDAVVLANLLREVGFY